METNPQLELANNIIKYTRTHLFLKSQPKSGNKTVENSI